MCLQEDSGSIWWQRWLGVRIYIPQRAEAQGLNEAINWLGTIILLPLMSIELDRKQEVQRSLSLSRTIPCLELLWKYAKLHLKNFKTLR